MYGVNRIYPEEGQGEEPGKSGTGGKFLRSLLWQELGINMVSTDSLKKMLSLSMPFLGAIIDVIDIKRL